MESKISKLFWKQPAKIVGGLFLFVVAFCVLLTFMPKWFRTMVTIVVIGTIFIGIAKNIIIQEEGRYEKKKTKNTKRC